MPAAVEAAKVNRSTLHRWLNEPDFLAMLNLSRAEMRDAQGHRLANLANDAIGVAKQAVDQAEARTALAVLRGVGLLSGHANPIGPSDAARVRMEQAENEKDLELRDLIAGL